MKKFYIALVSSAFLSTSVTAASLAPVVSGGVGEASRIAIEEVQSQYNTKFVFTGERGIYLADVKVSIRDKDGLEVVNGVSDGPFMLAELKPGKYTVEAEASGFNKKRTITAGNSLKTHQIQFPISDKINVSSADISAPQNSEHILQYNGQNATIQITVD